MRTDDAVPINPRITPLLRSVTALEVAVLTIAGLGLLLDVAAAWEALDPELLARRPPQQHDEP